MTQVGQVISGLLTDLYIEGVLDYTESPYQALSW
jgi:hypothetical protein